MKYLGILLVVAALVLAGSVAMALGAYDLEKWGGYNPNNNRFNGTSVGPISVTLQVWVYPYLYLTIDYTGFRWHLYEASAGETYDNNGDPVATAAIKTNWPEVVLKLEDFGKPARNGVEIPAQWGLGIGSNTWWFDADSVNGEYTRTVPGSQFTVNIYNKITIPDSGVATGQYTNTGKITATLPTSYWP